MFKPWSRVWIIPSPADSTRSAYVRLICLAIIYTRPTDPTHHIHRIHLIALEVVHTRPLAGVILSRASPIHPLALPIQHQRRLTRPTLDLAVQLPEVAALLTPEDLRQLVLQAQTLTLKKKNSWS